MKNNLDEPIQIFSEQEKEALVQQALELEQLEDREFQGTYRNDQKTLIEAHIIKSPNSKVLYEYKKYHWLS